MVVDAAQRQSVSLTPPELAISPVRFQREDGTSLFRPRHSAKYSSTAILEAEARLLARVEKPRPRRRCAASVLRRVLARLEGPAQRAAAALRWRASATSGRQVDLLVGPAGAGKTTTMRALRAAWIAEHGRGSVVGLAPSAAAAQALADDLGVACDNTAKWLHEYDHGRTELRAGQLVIIDEATLAGHDHARPDHWHRSRPRAPRCCSSVTRTNSSPSTPGAPSRSWSTGAPTPRS